MRHGRRLNSYYEKSASPRERRGHWRRRRSAVGNTWAGWGSIPIVFPQGLPFTRHSPYVRVNNEKIADISHVL